VKVHVLIWGDLLAMRSVRNQSGPGIQVPGLPGLIPLGERTDEHR